MLTTNQKGAIAETAIAHEAIKLGVGVSKPLSDLRYDFIFDTGKELLRVQCKFASRRGDVIVVRFYSGRRARAGLVRSFYGPDEIDAYAVYCGNTHGCYLFPIDEVLGARGALLRVGPTRNNQATGIRWARDYEFAAKLSGVLGP